ncbi:pre-16S rRNA-processing nuclease YqgF [Candidatus Atelocyanobacterium thalassae]|uniref:YqgF/RNase H-like domain-containing protein n=1 Tax=cyanobacterium endosymbiont of Braarudosphaera bigelowii TaxID=1285375 RepID=A0ABM7U6A6_9CHRO|nr:pre-16S rRNA-processing nuclease YqgF [Candidatus Atelocyanobacterium thalassa]BDA40298.1 hypothetical protein CPARK_000113500 [cyanobacterium endosymbiont of Braarudosphaera bigelowii]
MTKKEPLPILGFDPGRDKCGVAIVNEDGELYYHAVIKSYDVIQQLNFLQKKFFFRLLVIGDQTTSEDWKNYLEKELLFSVPIVKIDERNSTLEARNRYWKMYPPNFIRRLIPESLRIPNRSIDDIVAILLVERFLQTSKK